MIFFIRFLPVGIVFFMFFVCAAGQKSILKKNSKKIFKQAKKVSFSDQICSFMYEQDHDSLDEKDVDFAPSLFIQKNKKNHINQGIEAKKGFSYVKKSFSSAEKKSLFDSVQALRVHGLRSENKNILNTKEVIGINQNLAFKNEELISLVPEEEIIAHPRSDEKLNHEPDLVGGFDFEFPPCDQDSMFCPLDDYSDVGNIYKGFNILPEKGVDQDEKYAPSVRKQNTKTIRSVEDQSSPQKINFFCDRIESGFQNNMIENFPWVIQNDSTKKLFYYKCNINKKNQLFKNELGYFVSEQEEKILNLRKDETVDKQSKVTHDAAQVSEYKPQEIFSWFFENSDHSDPSLL